MITGISLVVAAFVASASGGDIAFVSGVGAEDRCVCVADAADGTIVRIGPGTGDGPPVWSPDGSRLAFSTRVPAGRGIVIVDGDGSATRALTHTHGWNRWPQWSGDGARLAYVSGDGTDTRIVVCDLKTGTEKEWGGGEAGFARPVWAGDDAVIAAGLLRDGERATTSLFNVTADAMLPVSGAQPVGDGPYALWAPALHPRGVGLAYESNDGGDREIFVLSFTNTKTVRIDVSNNRAADWNPVWSPDGKQIAFESFRGGSRGVYRVDPMRALAIPVAVHEGMDCWAPSWSDDGKWLAYVSNQTGNPEIFVTSVRDGVTKQVTDNGGDDLAPVWRPGGGR
jgi:Tol biopolymer transport system component